MDTFTVNVYFECIALYVGRRLVFLVLCLETTADGRHKAVYNEKNAYTTKKHTVTSEYKPIQQ